MKKIDNRELERCIKKEIKLAIAQTTNNAKEMQKFHNEVISLKEHLECVSTERNELADALNLCKQDMNILTSKYEKYLEITQAAQEIKLNEIIKEISFQITKFEKEITTYRSEIEELMGSKLNLLMELENREVEKLRTKT